MYNLYYDKCILLKKLSDETITLFSESFKKLI